MRNRRIASGQDPRRSSVQLVALVLAVLGGPLAGCGGGSAIPIDDLAASVRAADCRAAAECGDVPSQATCEASVSVTRDPALTAVVAAVKRGTVVYDGDKARQCLDGLGQSCVAALGALPSCAETFHGTVAPGGACQVSYECISGVCNAPCVSGCCVGSCAAGAAKVSVGGACAPGGGSCVDGAFCKGATCVADLAIGATCSPDDVCQQPALCSATTGGTGVCTAGADRGGACGFTMNYPCLSREDYCDPTTLVCLQKKPPGAACSGSECVGFASCLNGICTAHPTVGQACGANGSLSCLGDTACVGGVCVAAAPQDTCTP